MNSRRICRQKVCGLALLSIAMVACPKETEQQEVAAEAPAPEEKQTAAEIPPKLDESTLLLPQAQFAWEEDPSGKRKPVPGAAKLLMLRKTPEGFVSHVLEDPDSRVFHKAVCVQSEGKTTLLTIGGTDAILKQWSYENGAWQGTTLWKATFGGKWDRLRDMEIGDVNGDGKPEIVIVTHDQGVVAVLEHQKGKWVATEIYRSPNTFVHEVEIGDVDGDGTNEFYTTPSKPNRADRSQSGEVRRFAYNPKTKRYDTQVVVSYGNRHVKEILVTNLDGDKKDELYASVEAEKGTGQTKPLRIDRLIPKKKGPWKSSTLATLPGGVQSRVLLAADLTGRGKPELVATTMRGGIWRITPGDKPKAPWTTTQVDKSLSGFELAAGAYDLDGQGVALYVSGDDQDEIRELRYKNGKFESRVISTMDKSDLIWNVTQCKNGDTYHFPF